VDGQARLGNCLVDGTSGHVASRKSAGPAPPAPPGSAPTACRRCTRSRAYWLALPDGVDLDLNAQGEHRLRDDLGARAYDVFRTAYFLNFLPWAAALEYLLAQGIDTIAGHDQALVEQLIWLLDGSEYRFISPTDPDKRAAIVVIGAADPADNQAACPAAAF
jgi:hypothetical protein